MKMGEDDPSIEPASLEYIEDSYLPKMDQNVTPSLDDISEDDYRYLGCDDLDLSEIYDEHGASTHWSEEADMYLRSLTLDQILSVPDDLIDDSSEFQSVETEFSVLENSPPSSSLSHTNRLKNYLSNNKLRFLTRKKLRDVRVTFVDFSKPYLAKISSRDNYKNFLNIGNNTGTVGGVHALDPCTRKFQFRDSYYQVSIATLYIVTQKLRTSCLICGIVF